MGDKTITVFMFKSSAKGFDVTRLKSFISSSRAFLDHIVDKPEVDSPETNPHGYDLRLPPALLDIENEALAHCCRFLEMTREELVNSASARNSSGISKFDYARQVVYLDKIELFIKDYIEVAAELDLVESSPRAPIQGDGKKGV